MAALLVLFADDRSRDPWRRISAAFTASLRYAARHCFAFVSMSAVTGGALFGQNRFLMEQAGACTACVSLGIETIVSGPELQNEPFAVTRLRDGRVLMSFYPNANSVALFSGAGAFLETYARSGSGPGEVTYVPRLQLTQDGDTVLVFDSGSGRVEYFDQTGSYLRSERIPGRVLDSAPLTSGTWVLNVIVSTPALFGLPLHLFTVDRGLRQPFGSVEGGIMRPDLPYLSMRRITTDSTTRIWSAAPNSYEIQEWSQDGTEVRTWVRNAKWFPSYQQRRRVSPETGYLPWIIDLEWVGRNRVGVLIHVPAADWQAHLGPPVSGPDGHGGYPQLNVTAATDTRIEVVDVVTGRITVSQVLRGYYIGFLGPDRLVQYQLSATGEPMVTIARVNIGRR